MAYQMGLGGATPQAPYVQPTATPILANGAYTIASNGRAGCNNLLSAVNCNVDNTIQMAATGGCFAQLPVCKINLTCYCDMRSSLSGRLPACMGLLKHHGLREFSVTLLFPVHCP